MTTLENQYPHIKCFRHEKNLGGGATRNTAVSKADGDIIFCLDSDDILPAGTLAKMIDFLIEKKCDGVAVHRSIKFNGADINNIHHVDVSSYTSGRIPFTSLLSSANRFCPLYVNFMYTKEAFNKAGGYPTQHGYDTRGFAWRFLSAGLDAYTCPETEYLHRVNFNKSYYLREYNDGKMNYNWRDILLEHRHVLSEQALAFITDFDCSDFTKNILDELSRKDNVLLPDLKKNSVKKEPSLELKKMKKNYVDRNSLKGYYLRIKHRIKKLCEK